MGATLITLLEREGPRTRLEAALVSARRGHRLPKHVTIPQTLSDTVAHRSMRTCAALP
jgi:hypothetical protein